MQEENSSLLNSEETSTENEDAENKPEEKI